MFAAAQFHQGVILFVLLGIVHGVEFESSVFVFGQSNIQAIVGHTIEIMHFCLEHRYAVVHGHTVAQLIQQGEFILDGFAIRYHFVQGHIFPVEKHTPLLSVGIVWYEVFTDSLAADNIHLVGAQTCNAADELLQLFHFLLGICTIAECR